MKLKNLTDYLDQKLEKHTGQNWDNNGLLVGDQNNDITKVLLALELTDKVLEEAVELKIDLIIVHHPVIFSGLKKVINEGNSKLVYQLIANNVALYAAHTNFDALQGGLNDYIAQLLQGSNLQIIQAKDEEYGLLRVFDIKPITLEELAQILKQKLEISTLRYIGNSEDIISKVGVVTGSGSEYVELGSVNGAQAFITGDIKYHQAQEFKEKGLNVIDAGHFETEQTFAKAIFKIIKDDFEAKNIQIYLSQKQENPFIYS